MQRVTPGIGNAFVPVEKALQEIFLPALFKGLGEGSPERGFTRLPVKQAGLALPDPTLTAPERCNKVSCDETGRRPVFRGRQCWVWKGQSCLFH